MEDNYDIVMVSAIHQHELAIVCPLPPPPSPSQPSRLSQNFGFPVAYSKFPPVIHFTYGSVYIPKLLSHIISLLGPLLCPKSVLCIWISIAAVWIFLNACVEGKCSGTLHISLWSSPHHWDGRRHRSREEMLRNRESSFVKGQSTGWTSRKQILW